MFFFVLRHNSLTEIILKAKVPFDTRIEMKLRDYKFSFQLLNFRVPSMINSAKLVTSSVKGRCLVTTISRGVVKRLVLLKVNIF